jgi:outer membrane lipoprotein-sorting protein
MALRFAWSLRFRMLISRRALLAGAASLGVSARALAEEVPLDLQSGKRVKPPKDRPTDARKLSDAEIIAKANDFLNTTRFMSADFVQIGPDGRRSEGLLVLLRPGRMLFRYKPPQKMEIVADGRSLEVRDQKLATQDLYLIGQTPLKFLLSDHIDLANDTKVKRVEMDGHAATIEIEDKATLGGTSDITLVFDPDTFELKHWTVVDPQGFRTLVSLFALDLVTKPDPAWFYIDDRVQSNIQPNIQRGR